MGDRLQIGGLLGPVGGHLGSLIEVQRLLVVAARFDRHRRGVLHVEVESGQPFAVGGDVLIQSCAYLIEFGLLPSALIAAVDQEPAPADCGEDAECQPSTGPVGGTIRRERFTGGGMFVGSFDERDGPGLDVAGIVVKRLLRQRASAVEVAGPAEKSVLPNSTRTDAPPNSRVRVAEASLSVLAPGTTAT